MKLKKSIAGLIWNFLTLGINNS